MPANASPAQSEASRLNGARSAGPATAAGRARAALNGVRHGLCGRTFFLLPDEDPSEFARHEAMWLAVWAPRDLHEHQAAEAAIRAMWREIRAAGAGERDCGASPPRLLHRLLEVADDDLGDRIAPIVHGLGHAIAGGTFADAADAPADVDEALAVLAEVGALAVAERSGNVGA